MPLKVLIGLPVLDNIEMTRVCLDSLIAATDVDHLGLEVSVLIIDNGSMDDIRGLVRNQFSHCRFPFFYQRNETNLGVAPAWNQILKYSPDHRPAPPFRYDYYVISNNDVIYGPDWLQPLVEAMESDPKLGWISALENGSPVLAELLASHDRTKGFHVDPKLFYSAEIIRWSVDQIYLEWGGYEEFCRLVKDKGLPLFIDKGRSAVCFMLRPAVVEQIGFFDEDHAPIGVNEDLEYFLRLEKILAPPWLTDEIYPASDKWKYGFCGHSVIHHNWCMTRQGRHFDGRKWDEQKEKNWQAKFGRSRKHFSRLLPPEPGTSASNRSGLFSRIFKEKI